MIDRSLQDYWSSQQVCRRTLRTPAQKLIWLDRFLEPLVREAPRSTRERLLLALERERQMYKPIDGDTE